MSTDRQQSAIAEVRDQLSLDYADGRYLNVVAANLGMSRPPIGYSDDTWRAVVKLVALHYKQIATKFEDLLAVILGPRVTQSTSLQDPTVPNTRVFEINTHEGLPQRGVLVLDEGQATEETLEYSFVDRANRLLYVNDLPTFNHTALSSNVETAVLLDAAIGAGALTVSRGYSLPTEYPYTVVVGRGTPNEEALVVTNVTGDVVTLASPTTNAHTGLVPSVELTTLTQDYVDPSNYIIVDEVAAFPSSGFVVLRGATDEVVEYTSIDYDENMIILTGALTNAFPAGSYVELLDVQETLRTATIQVKGKGWDLWQVTPRLLEVYLPEECQDINTVRSASYLHPTATSPGPSTTLTADANPGDTTLTVTSTAAFPVTGVVSIGIERFAYTVTSGTVLTLAHGSVAFTHLTGVAVTLYEPVHPSTDLINGSLWSVADTYPGGYLYDLIRPAATNTVTTLNQKVSGPVRIVLDVPTGSTAVEVLDASAFELSSFPYTARFGEYTSNQEDLEVQAVHLRHALSEAVTAAPGGTTIEVAAATPFPTSARYRILIGRGTANEEVAYVTDYDLGTGVFTVDATLGTHAPGELVELLADVLTVSTTTRYHRGVVPYTSRTLVYPPPSTMPPETAAPVYTSLSLVTTTGFSTDGSRVLLNFGKNRITRTTTLDTLVTAGGVVLPCASTDDFPTTYPYAVVVNPGGFTEEVLLVSNNNVGTDNLTVLPARLAHAVGEPVMFVGPPTEWLVEYAELAGATVEFPAMTSPATFWPGTTAHYSDVDSVPSTQGTDFPFRMPTDIRTRLAYLIELVRAAGVRVEFIDQR